MKRRTFLAACGSLALARVWGASGTRKLRIGQIGTAGAHASGKMSAMRSLHGLWDVVGFVEPEPARLEWVRASRVFQDLRLLTEEELLGTPGLSAVAVETRIADASATAMRVIRAGKHVHLEKPGGFSHEEFKAMRLEAERRGLTVQMGYMLRYNPAFQLLYRAVREGWLGEITEIDVSIGKLGDADTRSTIQRLPGGGMFELGCHVIDTVVTLLGKPRQVLHFSTPTRDDGIKDNQTAVLQYPKATAIVRCNYADPFGDPRRRLNVTGTEGTFEVVPMESRNVTLSLAKPRDGYKKGTQTFQVGQPGGRYDGEFIDLAGVLKGERKFMWDAAHDIAVHETVLRASGVWE